MREKGGESSHGECTFLNRPSREAHIMRATHDVEFPDVSRNARGCISEEVRELVNGLARDVNRQVMEEVQGGGW